MGSVSHRESFISFAGMDDKTKVLGVLQEAAAECDAIAQVLGIRHGKIETTKKEHGKCEDRLSEYVDEWLKGNAEKECTRASLREVLRNKLVGRNDIADKIML